MNKMKRVLYNFIILLILLKDRALVGALASLKRKSKINQRHHHTSLLASWSSTTMSHMPEEEEEEETQKKLRERKLLEKPTYEEWMEEQQSLENMTQSERPTQTQVETNRPPIGYDKPKIVVLGASGRIGRYVLLFVCHFSLSIIICQHSLQS